jgi:DNA-binding MarR family transcriptional regulator
MEEEPELLLLLYLNNLGVIDEVRAMSIGDIAERLEFDPALVTKVIEKYLKVGYIKMVEKGEEPRYYISPEAVLKVSRFYT